MITLYCLQFVWADNSTADELTEFAFEESPFQRPTVFLPIIARNKAHALPVFLGYIERLLYPKNKISIWIQSDHNIDNTTNILNEWKNNVQHLYHRIDFHYSEEPQSYSDEKGPSHWPRERFEHLINLKQKALDEARKQWADYIFFVDCDNFIEEPDTLNYLIAEQKTIVAPMLESITAYSNFWCGMTESGYYKRTPEYMPTLKRERTGCFPVPMVHSTYLIDLKRSASTKLQFTPLPSYKGDFDDILLFAHSARQAEVQMYLLNKVYFGQLLTPLESDDALEDDVEQMVYAKLESTIDREQLLTSQYLTIPYPPATKLGFDEIYMINLVRREDRRNRMMTIFKELGIEAKHVPAVDGKKLTQSEIDTLGIQMLPGFADPYNGRELTKGEIGCFLSHYQIWKEVLEKRYSKVLILEDDIRFHYKFKPELIEMMRELEGLDLKWDLVYIGRKRMNPDKEFYVSGSKHLVWPYYTYWTLGYILSQKGALKLLDADPLPKLLPVDEYLPIMFNKHPEKDWAKHFWPRDLMALSAEPLLIEPTHYTGEPNYFSDTETSTIWSDGDSKEKHEEL
ncbi:procollagen galactosyltransferase 2-like [Glandiceps talaboti]